MTAERGRGAAALGMLLALQLIAAASLVGAASIVRIIWWRVPDWVVPTAIGACLLIGAGVWLWSRAPRPARLAASAGSMLCGMAWTATQFALASASELSGWIVAAVAASVAAATIALLLRQPTEPR